MLVQEPVQAAIWHCLNHYDYADAIFLAERLRAEVESDETIWLLATCYYRSGKPSQAYHILKNTSSPQCRFLLAKCCIDLQKLSEAERVLSGSDMLRSRNLEEVTKEFGDIAGFALILLATINCSTDRHHKGSDVYKMALKMNPLLWSAFEALCKSGEAPSPTSTFSTDQLSSLSSITGTNPVINYVNSHAGMFGACQKIESNHSMPVKPEDLSTSDLETPVHQTPSNIVFNNNKNNQKQLPLRTPIQIVNMGGTCMSGVREFTPDDVSPLPLPPSCRPKRAIRYRNIFPGSVSPLTPSFGVIPLDFSSSDDSTPLNTLTEANEQKLINKRVMVGSRIGNNVGTMRGGVGGGSTDTLDNGGGGGTAPSGGQSQGGLPSTPRRSTRLFSNNFSVKENSKSPNRGKFAAPKSPSRKTKAARGLNKGVRSSTTNNNNNNAAMENEKNSRSGAIHQQNHDCRQAFVHPSSGTPTLGLPSSGGGTTTAGTTNTVPSCGTGSAASDHSLSLQRHSLEGLVSLLRELGWAYLYLSAFECKKAIKCLSQIPPHHRNTGWVLSLMAKAYFEDNNFKHAAKHFAEVRSREPERTQMMEIYSTALWHLSKENQLSALAQDLMQADKNCPETWCAAGNCMSLQKEHDAAIKFFQRAVQIDPTFVYAYTLLGHEYVVTDELDKGMSCFRNAVRLDPRHYNAWYGIGTIYSKQERFQLAELHYKRALAINPHSCVLMCHIGVMQHALQRREDALATLNQALALEPNNALCKFHRASVLTSCNMHHEAIQELEQLKELVPKESMVYYLTGKVHKKLGNTHLALMHFSWATDLDPKGATPQIKEAIDPTMSSQAANGTPSAGNHSSPDMGEEIVGEELAQRTPSNNQGQDANDFSY